MSCSSGPSGSSGVRGPVWTSEDQSELQKLSQRLTRNIGRSLSDHTDWPPVVMYFPGAELLLCPRRHLLLRPTVQSRDDLRSASLLHKVFNARHWLTFACENPCGCFRYEKATVLHFPLLGGKLLMFFINKAIQVKTWFDMYCGSNNSKCDSPATLSSACFRYPKTLVDLKH